ncbi:MAG: hypothetical protein R8K47_04295 [Mariprofundaceae bacterium]
MEDEGMYFDFNRPMGTLLPAWRAMLVAPADFFRALPRARTRINGFFLLSVTTLLTGGVGTVVHDFSWLFLLPVVWGVMLMAGWLWAAWLRRVSTLAGGERLPRATAFEIAGYTALPLALLPVPWVGWLGLVLAVFLQVQALVARCGAQGGRVWMLLGMPVALFTAAAWTTWTFLIAPQLAA